VRGLLISLFAATIVLTYMQSRKRFTRGNVEPNSPQSQSNSPQPPPQPSINFVHARDQLDPKIRRVFSAIADVYTDLPVLIVDAHASPYSRLQFNLSAVLLGGATFNPRASECAITHRGHRWSWTRHIQMQFDTDIKGDIELVCNFPAVVGIKLT
jgi:hypothetical protein